MPEDIDKLTNKRKSGFYAAVLNLFFPGLGYIYCGMYVIGSLILLTLLLLATYVHPSAAIALYAGCALVFFIDGFLAANRYNKKLDKKINAAMKICPRCAEKVLPTAIVCKHCGGEFITE